MIVLFYLFCSILFVDFLSANFNILDRFLIIVLTVISKDISCRFANPMLPWWVLNSALSCKILSFLKTHLNSRGFVVLITCAFMIVIGQRGTISGFALLVILSVWTLHWILHKAIYAGIVISTIPTPLDLCWGQVLRFILGHCSLLQVFMMEGY